MLFLSTCEFYNENFYLSTKIFFILAKYLILYRFFKNSLQFIHISHIFTCKSVFFHIIIFVFCLCLLPIISKATYSSELYSVSLDCDESGLTDTSVSCKIVLETGELNIQGFSAKISSELTYEEFKYLEGDWKNYSDTNYAAADGLVLVSDGTLGSSYIGELVYKIPREIFSDSANIMIEEVVIVDDNSLEYEIGTVEAEISVLKRDVSTLDGIGLSSGKLDKEFSPEVTEYTVNVNASTIKIVPYPTDLYSNVSGDIGEVSLEYGENIFEFLRPVAEEEACKETFDFHSVFCAVR